MIRVVNISKIYNKSEVPVHALSDATLTISAGEFVAIVGKSGAGKSTLLYQMSLLDRPTEGKVFIEDTDTSTFKSKERTAFRLFNFGYIFQDYALLPELTAENNIIVPLLMQGVDGDDARGIACSVLTRLGLGERIHNRPNQLSGGEQQRVAIARAIAHKPRVLFADEPTASLDSETSQVIIDYLKELNKEGQTIVMITHEKEYSDQAHRIVELSDGRICADSAASH